MIPQCDRSWSVKLFGTVISCVFVLEECASTPCKANTASTDEQDLVSLRGPFDLNFKL